MVGERGGGDFRGAVLPHAGLFYSAPLIRSFFSGLAPEVKRLVIMAPSHYVPLAPDEVVSYPFDSAETPYGDVDVFPFPAPHRQDRAAMEREHAIEMFIPWAGKLGLACSFCCVSRFSSVASAEAFAKEALSAVTPETAFIASSDFTHYGPRFGWTPFGDGPEDKVRAHDAEAARLMAEGDAERVFSAYRDSTICGLAPALAGMGIARALGLKGENGPAYISSDITGRREADFVSYATVYWRNS